MSIRVVKSGLQVTLQDRGRRGQQDLGVPVGGAMDDWSARLANLLVGNDQQDAVLEVALHGMALLFETEHLVAVTGGGAKVRVNEEEVPMGKSFLVKPWSAMRFHSSPIGFRTYLAVAGGFDLPAVMGSRSTYLTAGIGGFSGRALEEGDVLEACREKSALSHSMLRHLRGDGHEFIGSRWSFATSTGPDLLCKAIRFMPGPEWGLLTEAQQKQFSTQPFVITSQSNRMGYRLRGQPLALAQPHEMVSSAVTKGSVQLTHDGQPVLLMADAQTTGGYPRIAQVAAADMPVCAQYRPGDRMRFKPVSFAEARKAWMDREKELELIGKNLDLLFNT
jgi:antagonist of KipI